MNFFLFCRRLCLGLGKRHRGTVPQKPTNSSCSRSGTVADVVVCREGSIRAVAAASCCKSRNRVRGKGRNGDTRRPLEQKSSESGRSRLRSVVVRVRTKRGGVLKHSNSSAPDRDQHLRERTEEKEAEGGHDSEGDPNVLAPTAQSQQSSSTVGGSGGQSLGEGSRESTKLSGLVTQQQLAAERDLPGQRRQLHEKQRSGGREKGLFLLRLRSSLDDGSRSLHRRCGSRSGHGLVVVVLVQELLARKARDTQHEQSIVLLALLLSCERRCLVVFTGGSLFQPLPSGKLDLSGAVCTRFGIVQAVVPALKELQIIVNGTGVVCAFLSRNSSWSLVFR